MREGSLEMIVCTLVWGSIGPIAKQLEVSTSVVVFFRVFLGGLVVLAYLAIRGRLGELRQRRGRPLLIASGVVLAIHWWMQFEAFSRLDVASAILIVFLGPVLIALVAPRVLGERRSVVALGALAVSVGGIVLIATPRTDLDTLGLLAALGAAILFAVLILIGKVLTREHEPVVIVGWQLSVASVVLAPGLIGADPGEVLAAAPGMALLGLVHTGLIGILFFRAVRALPAQHLSVLFYLEPVSAVPYAWWWLGEAPAATTLIGGAMIVAAGLAIISVDRRTLPPLEVT